MSTKASKALGDSFYIASMVILKNFSKIVSDKYNVPFDELMELWNDENILKNDKSISNFSNEMNNTKNSKNTNSSNSSNSCIYKYKRGDKKNTTCGNKICKKYTTGFYCIYHVNEENKSPKVPKDELSSVPVKESKPKEKLAIRKNKYGNFVHEPTQLVFKSYTEKVVTKKQSEDGKLTDLSEEDIENCKKYGFKYEINEESENEDENEEKKCKEKDKESDEEDEEDNDD